MRKQKIAVVIPTIRDLSFLKTWKIQFEAYKDLIIIICEDHPTKQIKIPKIKNKIFHYSWQEIDSELKEKSWIIPRKVSAIRNFGFLKAHQMKVNIIVTIDDDCYPVKNHELIIQHTNNLSLKTPKNWVNTYPDINNIYTRGMPYLNRNEMPIMISHGLWTNVIDHDGPTQLQNLNFKTKFSEHFLQIIPSNTYYPMCSMNLAFKCEITPLMYFPLMGEDKDGNKWGYDRFDDIWAGIFSKKILDHLNFGVVNGSPFVKHNKASNPFKNLQKEASGIETNELIWKIVDKVNLTKKSPKECYLELARKIKFPKGKYFIDLKKAMIIWGELFKNA